MILGCSAEWYELLSLFITASRVPSSEIYTMLKTFNVNHDSSKYFILNISPLYYKDQVYQWIFLFQDKTFKDGQNYYISNENEFYVNQNEEIKPQIEQ